MKTVLFVCIGNTCRSPMAEGLANHYGSDVLRASSAGLAPTPGVAPETVATMMDIDVDVSKHIPRRYEPFEASQADLVVNMAGFKLPGAPAACRRMGCSGPLRLFHGNLSQSPG